MPPSPPPFSYSPFAPQQSHRILPTGYRNRVPSSFAVRDTRWSCLYRILLLLPLLPPFPIRRPFETTVTVDDEGDTRLAIGRLITASRGIRMLPLHSTGKGDIRPPCSDKRAYSFTSPLFITFCRGARVRRFPCYTTHYRLVC